MAMCMYGSRLAEISMLCADYLQSVFLVANVAGA